MCKRFQIFFVLLLFFLFLFFFIFKDKKNKKNIFSVTSSVKPGFSFVQTFVKYWPSKNECQRKDLLHIQKKKKKALCPGFSVAAVMSVVNKFNWSFECFSLIWQKSASTKVCKKKCHFYRIDIKQWLLPSERAFFSWRALVNFILSSPQNVWGGMEMKKTKPWNDMEFGRKLWSFYVLWHIL